MNNSTKLFQLIAAERKAHPELTTYAKAQAHVLSHHRAAYVAATAQTAGTAIPETPERPLSFRAAVEAANNDKKSPLQRAVERIARPL